MKIAGHYVFSVLNEPYCVWSWNLAKQNSEFASQITPEYFEYICRKHIENVDVGNEQHAALAIRSAYHLSLETLFSLIGAALQSPHCLAGWISKVSTSDLRAVVDALQNDRMTYPIHWTPAPERFGFEGVARLVFQNSPWASQEGDGTIQNFAQLWRRLAADFLDENLIREYNSIKHGFRAASGGFSIRVGLEKVPGKACDPTEMRDMGGSQFGTSFFTTEPIGSKSKGDRNFRLKRTAINWLIENTANRLLFAALSIKNLKAFLQVAAGVEPGAVQFYRPEDPSEYLIPWATSPGVLSSSFELVMLENHIQRKTREELLKIVRAQIAEAANSDV